MDRPADWYDPRLAAIAICLLLASGAIAEVGETVVAATWDLAGSLP